MIKKRVFAVLSLILVLALSVVSVFAEETASNPSYVLSDDMVSPPVPLYCTFNYRFLGYSNSHIFSVSRPVFSALSINSDIAFVSGYHNFSGPSIVLENGDFEYVSKLQFFPGSYTSVYYDTDAFSGVLRGSTSFRDSFELISPDDSFISETMRTSVSFSATDFFAFSKEQFADIDSDQNSQISLLFDGPTFRQYFSVSDSTYSFELAVVGQNGLGQFVSYSGSVEDFYWGSYYNIDPGFLIRENTGEPVFYFVRNFTCNLVFLDSSSSSAADNVVTFPFLPVFHYSFVYSPIFDDISFIAPQPQMELQDYTAWITTAVSGFFDIQIFPGFYLSGFLMVVIAFACVIWFLKIFAGG